VARRADRLAGKDAQQAEALIKPEKQSWTQAGLAANVEHDL
jgi:hypothetical protein